VIRKVLVIIALVLAALAFFGVGPAGLGAIKELALATGLLSVALLI
jgi:hypothetical protein